MSLERTVSFSLARVLVYLHEMHIYSYPVALMSRNNVSSAAKFSWDRCFGSTEEEGRLCGVWEVPELILRERGISGKGVGGRGHITKPAH